MAAETFLKSFSCTTSSTVNANEKRKPAPTLDWREIADFEVRVVEDAQRRVARPDCRELHVARFELHEFVNRRLVMLAGGKLGK